MQRLWSPRLRRPRLLVNPRAQFAMYDYPMAFEGRDYLLEASSSSSTESPTTTTTMTTTTTTSTTTPTTMTMIPDTDERVTSK